MPIKHNIENLMEQSGVKFGTSGARGLAEEMSDEVCYSYTLAFLQHLEDSKNISLGSKVAIAGDLRPSTPRICAAVARAVNDKGYRAVYSGPIPSPAVAYYGFTNKIPSIMVTGSHIPDDRNGIKYNTPIGEIMKSDEEGIRQQNVSVCESLFNENGFFIEEYSLPELNLEAERKYIKRYTDFFSSDFLSGLKIGIYEHSCVGRDVLKKIYSKLGAEVTGLGRSEAFIPVDTEAIRPEDAALARTWGLTGEYDAILSADGDCDRPLIADENGQWLRGDIAGIICAEYLQADVVVTPVSCNTAVESCSSFKDVIRTKIGSPFVIAGMKEASQAGTEMVVGYEANGGFLVNSDFKQNAKVLKALPTRDAVILHLALLADSKNKGCKISELVKAMPGRFTASNRLQGFPTEKSMAKLQLFYSGVFEEDKKYIEESFRDLCGDLVSIDITDGVRMTFANTEVIHFRASGNAPELRCYNEADSESRALELNDKCMSAMAEWRELSLETETLFI